MVDVYPDETAGIRGHGTGLSGFPLYDAWSQGGRVLFQQKHMVKG